MADFKHGDIVKYDYLWAREHEKGEITGRKTRPSCVMLIVPAGAGKSVTLIFPITSQRPGPETLAVEVTAIEGKRSTLRLPAWVIVEEFNVDDLENSFALQDVKAIGTFSAKFMSVIAASSAAAIRAGRLKHVPRK